MPLYGNVFDALGYLAYFLMLAGLFLLIGLHTSTDDQRFRACFLGDVGIGIVLELGTLILWHSPLTSAAVTVLWLGASVAAGGGMLVRNHGLFRIGLVAMLVLSLGSFAILTLPAIFHLFNQPLLLARILGGLALGVAFRGATLWVDVSGPFGGGTAAQAGGGAGVGAAVPTAGGTHRFCPNCGAPMEAVMVFCAGCGAELKR